MRFFSADTIYTSDGAPVEEGVVVTDDVGRILDVLEKGNPNISPEQNIEFHEGIICPGFVNAHCHLELSHLKDAIPQHTGLDVFIRDIMKVRVADEETRQLAMEQADRLMEENGIVAVGDICNGDSSFQIKSRSKIYYHSFIELFGFDPEHADRSFERGLDLYQKTKNIGKGNASIVPHSPYSVSEKLFMKINSWAYENNGLLSIHMQENEDENLFFKDKSGPIPDRIKDFGIDISKWKASGYDSLMSTVIFLPKCNPILLVHNTVATLEDINWFKKYTDVGYWCLCPLANLYIEDKLPQLNLYSKLDGKVCLGTDSLASNGSLSILEEMKILSRSGVSLDLLIEWATINGASFLGIHDRFGKIRKGFIPGLNLITGLDKNKNLLKESSVRRLI